MSSACSLISHPHHPYPLVPWNCVHPSGLSPNSVFLCCDYYFTLTSLLGSSEMWKTIRPVLSNLRQKRLQVPQHFACSLSLASLPTELWSLSHSLSFPFAADGTCRNLSCCSSLPLLASSPAELCLCVVHVGMEFIMSYFFMFLPSGLLLLPPSVNFFLCLSSVRSSLFIHTSVLWCLTSAHWTEPFLCSEKSCS